MAMLTIHLNQLLGNISPAIDQASHPTSLTRFRIDDKDSVSLQALEFRLALPRPSRVTTGSVTESLSGAILHCSPDICYITSKHQFYPDKTNPAIFT